ncbi:MAG: 2-succinyl-6-hydroxy-2,4-cyclohexadiene-1-carboxylate synthase, partial [Kamptonema sp. SIO4C4]|nr:2-succinyl-6-hydroxy-2,4-cyclohexadiene-1-carboxylate synthase [Kamptonema sp. SIO4C4]
ITQSYLVGYSMGGRIALYLALHFPQYFPKVILESASPGLATAAEREKRRNRDEQLAQQLETIPFADFLTRWYNNPLFASLKPHPQFSSMYQRRLNNSPSHLAYSLRYCGTGVQPSLWDKLSQLSQPLLLLVGEQDQKFLGINQKISQHCPTAQLQVIKNCGHNIHLETLHSFSYTVQQFLHGL